MATFDSERKIWQGPKIPFKFPTNASIGVEILKKLKETPDRTMIISHDDGITMTCEEARIASIRVAQNLTKLGFKKGDVIGFICRNGIRLPPTIYGALLIGAPINPLDAGFKKDDIKHMFAQTQPKLVFCDADVYETTKQALNELDNNAVVMTHREKIEGVVYVDELLAPTGNEDSFEPPQFGNSSDMLAIILCSSGTTGPPKGVCLSHAHIFAHINLFNESEGLRILSFSPIYWSTGVVSTITVAFRSQDAKIITAQPFGVDLLIQIIKKHDINFIQFAPYQLMLLLQSPLLDPRDFVGVKIFSVLGSVVSEHLRKEFRSVFPRHPLIVTYGMSEACITISSTEPHENICGLTVGHISPNIQVRVVDNEGNPLGIEDTGEIYAKPEFKFIGYYNNPEASLNAIDSEGFLKTGDIGHIDEKGCIFIIDRKKEIMKYKGYQINPSEIENIIESIEGVEVVSVVGIPDPIAHNLPAAVIVKRPEFEDLTEQFIIDYVAEKLPEYKHLHGGAYFIDEIPMTPTGKILKRFVKVLAIKEHNEKYSIENFD
ncbi:CLUMA_CG011357, isoform A [Clunio marinus]|uniref:CLUMA_CG011357, isoform A n=1 Tax=Clunio marinus TaxID=568069 RepID=A0A1J1IHQ3_9DIPT|nr:CLUMA_CG011357, isoform A [Clunio marinus]